MPMNWKGHEPTSHWVGYAEPDGLSESKLSEVVAVGNRRRKDGQINRQLDPQTYDLLVKNREQARGDLLSAEGHHLVLTRVHDRAILDYEGEEN